MLLFVCEERAKALAEAVSGEALPYECLNGFRPENGMILANSSAIGMEPNEDQTPICKVLESSTSFHMCTYLLRYNPCVCLC